MPDFKIDPDYVEVAQRLRDLFYKHPEATVRGTYEIVEIAGQARVIYRAECYRTPDDPAPGVGTAWEEVPGKTPYTKGSELQNAETSAWGRAIVAVGASTSKRIASADEMRSARARQDAPPEHSRPAPNLDPPEHVARVNGLVDAVQELNLADWVRGGGFPWPWGVKECDAIERKVAETRTATGPSRPPEPPDARVPPCAADASDTPENPAETAESQDAPDADPVEALKGEVEAMSSDAVYAALTAVGLSGSGAPKALRQRLLAYRVQQVRGADATVADLLRSRG